MHRIHRTSRRPLVAVAVLALLAPLALSSPVATARGAASELNGTLDPGPQIPLTVGSYDPQDPPTSRDVWGSIYTEETVEDVVATVVEHDGLYVDPLVTTVGTVGQHRTGHFSLAVRAQTPGLHTLTVEVSAPGAETKRLSLPFVWSPGGPPIPDNQPLAGRLYATSDLSSYPCGSGRCRYRTSSRVAFLSGHRSTSSLALDGRKVCGPAPGCTPYRHDADTGLVQIGDDTIGRITGANASIDGESYVRMAYPRARQRLDGRWLYGADVEEGRGVWYQDLKLRENGTFWLHYAVDTTRYTPYGEPEVGSSYGRTLSGRYAIGRHGRLTLTDPQRGTKVATLALLTTPVGKPRASTLGVWLDLSIHPPEGGSFVDGNLMNPLG